MAIRITVTVTNDETGYESAVEISDFARRLITKAVGAIDVVSSATEASQMVDAADELTKLYIMLDSADIERERE